ncbi:metallophosphoesterase [Actibacterium ureilyticum]|uniref:metallophosphoesterase n=1 Tax=Actibacterium ureilyticum TaxID=1590614 RepID=UPI000BAB1BEE|nr:metallophosphoesterase [Actibacterium ureilyticum]
MRFYAIGDIHGHLDKLHGVHDLIAADRLATGDPAAPVVHLGDFADRGPDVRGVLDFLIDGIAAGQPWICLKGNHDRMMEHYLRSPEQPDPLRDDLHWLQDIIGGRETLASYGVDVSLDRNERDIHADATALVPPAHRAFLQALPNHHHAGAVYFCHAGIRPGVPLPDQVEDDLVWIRREFHDAADDHGALIVHGHTPVDRVTHYGNRLNLDTGAAYGRALSVAVIEGHEVAQLTPTGRKPLPPSSW